MSKLAVSAPAPDQAPVWVALDAWTYALCQLTGEPRLDGFGKQCLEPVSLYEYDPFQGQWLSHALPTASPFLS